MVGITYKMHLKFAILSQEVSTFLSNGLMWNDGINVLGKKEVTFTRKYAYARDCKAVNTLLPAFKVYLCQQSEVTANITTSS